MTSGAGSGKTRQNRPPCRRGYNSPLRLAPRLLAGGFVAGSCACGRAGTREVALLALHSACCGRRSAKGRINKPIYTKMWHLPLFAGPSTQGFAADAAEALSKTRTRTRTRARTHSYSRFVNMSALVFAQI